MGANKVLIPEVEISGLGDYDRDTGFVTGTITVSSTPYTLTMDRGRSFQLDAGAHELAHHLARQIGDAGLFIVLPVELERCG